MVPPVTGFLMGLAAAIFICHSASSQSLSDPCGGSNPVQGSSKGLSVTGNLPAAMRDIVTSAIEAKTLAGLLKDKYTKTSPPRISPFFAIYLKGIHEKNFPVSRSLFNQSAITAALQSDYDDVSTIITFMKYIYKYETEYTVDMEAFQHKLYSPLCKIKIAADANGQSLTYTITDDVVTRKVIISDAFRYARDYTVFRDAEVFLASVTTPYVN
ncbi:uncharacterized protein LOC124253667 [Haliotis rubra]|uniref:uncharacterized protein LOC124253667 n=1 Tax=Haliotis rubra TaxID=36100 RepID=UPI001EE5CD98|nr:uncharacterized protein LOC124253667 [Haliotis rubra]